MVSFVVDGWRSVRRAVEQTVLKVNNSTAENLDENIETLDTMKQLDVFKEAQDAICTSFHIRISPVRSLRKSNDAPTQQQVRRVRRAIKKAEKERRSLLLRRMKILATNEPLTMAPTLKRLKSKLSQVDCFIAEHKCVISPLRHLPPELLQEIFAHCLWHPTRGTKWNSLPWSLGQVCRYWREVVLNTSTLWTTIPTLYLKKANTESAYFIARLKELLRRSGGTPLDIWIDCTADMVTHPALNALMAESHRWRSLSFVGNYPILNSLRAVKDNLPNLENLTLQIWRSETDTPLDMFSIAPRLRSVLINGKLRGNIALSVSQLTHYNERSLVMPINPLLYRVVTSATSLSSLVAVQVGDYVRIPLGSSLPALRYLTIMFQRDASSFIDSISVPAIEEIKIIADGESVFPSLVKMLDRSTSPGSVCPLKVLHARSGLSVPGDISTLLTLTPNIEELDIPLPYARDIIDLAEVGYNGELNLAPRLKTCRFFLEEFTNEDTCQAVRLLSLRRCEVEVPQEDVGVEDLVLRDGHSASFTTSASGWDVDTVDQVYPKTKGPLKSLQLYSKNREFSGEQRGLLQRWNDSKMTRMLEEYNKFISFGFVVDWDLKRSATFNCLCQGWLEGMTILMLMIKGQEILDAGDIMDSSLYHILRKLVSHPRFYKSEFVKVARDIICDWEKRMLCDLDGVRWARQGHHAVTYIPSDHGIRKSSDALSLVNGLEQIPYSIVYWPTFLTQT